ncbi:hypothetical protein BC628DRAFT_1378651, partial [Trametes gibbosa]
MMWTRACSPTGRPIEICGVLLFLVCSPLAGPRRTVRGSSVNGKECWWSVSAWRTTQRTQAPGTDRRLPPVTRSAPGTALRRARDCRLRSITCLSSCGNSPSRSIRRPQNSRGRMRRRALGYTATHGAQRARARGGRRTVWDAHTREAPSSLLSAHRRRCRLGACTDGASCLDGHGSARGGRFAGGWGEGALWRSAAP